MTSKKPIDQTFLGGCVASMMGLAMEMVPHADKQVLRKLAWRLIEAQLRAFMAEIRVMSGKPLRCPEGLLLRQPVADLVNAKPPPRVSGGAAMYAEVRVARRGLFWR